MPQNPTTINHSHTLSPHSSQSHLPIQSSTQRWQLAAAAIAMARAPTMVIQEDYIDMDLTPTTTPLPPSSPRCAGGGLREFEFHSSAAVSSKAFASPADELFYKGNLLPLHLPPRLQLVQKLLQEQQVQVQGIKKAAAAAAAAEVEDDIVDMSKVCAKKYSWSKRLKLMKRWTSREYIKSHFLATAKPSDIGVGGNGGCGGSVLDQEELCGHRKSFSGIIRRVRLVATKAASASAPATSPLCSTSSSSSSTPSCGNASGFLKRPAAAALKRSSSAGSEEGAIQGAIAHCKRSQHQHLQQQRRSVSDVVFYSVTNTPRVSSVAAGEATQERQEMCRG